jgi:JmjC domain, hydroxylase
VRCDARTARNGARGGADGFVQRGGRVPGWRPVHASNTSSLAYQQLMAGVPWPMEPWMQSPITSTPPNPQFFLGPAGSGAQPHTHREAVNVIAYGRKLWAIFPPAHALYGTLPASRFFSSALPSILRTAPHTVRLCVQDAGDALYIPADFAHAVLNLEATVGVAVEFDSIRGAGDPYVVWVRGVWRV